MAIVTGPSLAQSIAADACPMQGLASDHDPLLQLAGNARFVLLGEATHGTHEFYQERAAITRRLIIEKGFTALAVEADWPDAYRVNRYVRGVGNDANVREALSGFERFPAWMWRNHDVLEFVDWLRTYNTSRAADAPQVGFYGLDLYSLFSSIEEVLRYLDRIDPEAARRARERYACFDHYHQDSQRYGYATGYGLAPTCEDEVVSQLGELRRRASEYRNANDGNAELARDEFFFVEQNARLAQSAERYYRAMFQGRISSWNLRDRHMADTLEALSAHLLASGVPAKIVVWEHNSHIGDASATEIGRQGEWNVGQLAREAYGQDAVLIGFTTHHGTVTAASQWDAPAERKRVLPALSGSVEKVFHQTGIPRFMLPLRASGNANGRAGAAAQALSAAELLERAIGVIYLPESERESHYFYANVAHQFDAVIHIDETSALQPLDAFAAHTKGGEAPETYPQGL